MMTEKRTALVVDDELPVRALLVRALSEVGFQCVESADGEDAWEQHQRAPFDVVVTDLKMPKMNGHKLCVELLGASTRPIVTVLTAVRHERLNQDLQQRGVDLIRHKPINFRTLARELRSLADEQSSRRTSLPDADSGDSSGETRSSASKPRQAKHNVGLLLHQTQMAEELAADISDESTACFATSSSEQLCHVLDRQRIDLLLIENNLGGFMTGLEIVERLNQQLIRPKIVLLSDLDDKTVQQADEIGVEIVAPVNTDRTELIAEVRRILRDTTEQDAFIPPLARHLVKDFGAIPPLPQLVVKLAGYLAMPINEIPLNELADDIATDSQATTDLLHITNCGRSMFEQTTSILQAVNLQGAQNTISQVMSMATMRAQSKVLNQWNEAYRQWYQKRSVIVAAAGSVFADKFEHCSPDTAYILGLVQDVGCLVMANKFGSRYDRIVKRVQEVGRCQLHQLELESFSIHHAHVSAALLQKWNLPQSLVRTVVAHHDVDGEDHLTKSDASYLRVIRLAEAFANSMEMPHPYRNFQLSQFLSRYTDFSHDERMAICGEALQRARHLCEVFEFPVPDELELEDILQRSTVPI
ncbi:HDOD domain-containing protein [Bremerella sp. JC817]|uniref:HDOD domain-containing protein n=1 Tax=Bremerella sp. JC817 TaxID=3231756 RepID=UPI00345ABC41